MLRPKRTKNYPGEIDGPEDIKNTLESDSFKELKNDTIKYSKKIHKKKKKIETLEDLDTPIAKMLKEIKQSLEEQSKILAELVASDKAVHEEIDTNMIGVTTNAGDNIQEND